MDIPIHLYESIIDNALAEDIGVGDVTTTLCIKAGQRTTATVLAKSPGVVAGLEVGAAVFRKLDPHAEWKSLVPDGTVVGEGKTPIANVYGDARALLTGERLALNLMQRMSGTATITRRFVDLVAGTKAWIIDTRKTTPGLRVLEKYAVRVGGGHNHRFGLYDAVLIKDNHIRAAGGIAPAVKGARAGVPHTMKVEVETTNLMEVEQALAVGADIILLDNMDLATLKAAVDLVAGRAITEASGRVNESTVAAIAATGVDVISVGALTHSAPAMDISLDFETR
jgi:nicotinate-nucleotide pyrophosphorylase (carboxylating)